MAFMSIVNDFVLFILFKCPHSEFIWFECGKIRTRKTSNKGTFYTVLGYNVIQAFNPNWQYFSGFWSSWASMGLNNCFVNSFLKTSTKPMWVCSNAAISKQFCHISFKLRPITSLKQLWLFKHTTLVASNTNATSLTFLVLRSLATLYLNATSTAENTYSHVFCSRNYEVLQQIKLKLLIRFYHLVMGITYFLRCGVWTCQSACFAKHDFTSFFGINVILWNSLIVLLPTQRW